MPIQLALFHLVELLLHAGGEGDIHEVREILLTSVSLTILPSSVGKSVVRFAHDVPAVARQDRGDRRRVGGRAADVFPSSARTSEALGVARRRWVRKLRPVAQQPALSPSFTSAIAPACASSCAGASSVPSYTAVKPRISAARRSNAEPRRSRRRFQSAGFIQRVRHLGGDKAQIHSLYRLN